MVEKQLERSTEPEPKAERSDQDILMKAEHFRKMAAVKYLSTVMTTNGSKAAMPTPNATSGRATGIKWPRQAGLYPETA
ncbi:MAG: hypothetical protein HW384_1602 [Dehalococcoidia bacterium]|nr:hypothetical protein [Dehalococcoidia bacterium]